MQFRNDIQGLRAIAVLLVLIFHISSKWLPGGFIGVDVFFVISGFLITKIITSKINKGTFSLKEFYISRVKRIVPAYYFLLICTAIVFLYIFLMPDVGNFRLTYFWALVFNSNYYFSTVDNYFGFSSNENPLLHTWTLGVEMQFYLFLPVLLLIKNKKITSAVLMLLVVLLFSYATMEIDKGNKGLMYFSLLARTPEFLIGSLLAISNLEQNKAIQSYKNVFSIIGLVGLIISAFLITENSFFPGVGVLPPILFSGLLLCTHDSFLNNILSKKLPVYIGELSYSIYLWHWPVISFIRYYNASYDLSNYEIGLVLFITILGSLVSYYGIERPLRFKNGTKFYLTLFILISVNLVLIYYLVPFKRLITSGFPQQFLYPKEFIKSHGLTFEKVENIGDENYKGKKILLIGDSHAHIFKTYFDKLGKKEKFSMRTITNSYIPSFPDLVETKELKSNVKYQKYKTTLQKIVIKEIDIADVVIVMVYGNGQKWIVNLENLVKMPNKKILFIKDYPHLDIDPVRVNRDYIKNKNYHYIIEKFSVPKPIRKLSITHKNFKIVEFTNEKFFFRDAPFFNDTIIYSDQDHLNYYGSQRYVDYTGNEFMKYLNWALEK